MLFRGGGGLDGSVFDGVFDGVFGDDAVTGVVGDVVVEELSGVVVDLLGVFVRDFGGNFEEFLARGDVQVVAGDFDAPADVACGDALGEFVRGLIGVLGDFVMPLFVVDDGFRGVDRNPNSGLKLQGHQHVGDRERRVLGVGAARLASNAGARNEVGIADGGFTGMEGRHVGRRSGGIESVRCVGWRKLGDLDGVFLWRSRGGRVWGTVAGTEGRTDAREMQKDPTQEEMLLVNIFAE